MPTKNRLLPQAQRGRPSSKLKEVVARLRSSILSGEYAPGSRLHTYDELEPMLDVSRATLRHAIGVLKREGFINSVERSGMHVAIRPPHLARYGLIFCDVESHDRFQLALMHVAEELSHSGEMEIVVFHGVHPGSNHPDWMRLVKDLKSHRLAGLITVAPSEHLEGTGALEDDTLPKIGFRSYPEPGFRRIVLDNKSLIDQAVDWFVSQERRKIAVICAGGAGPSGNGTLDAEVVFAQSCIERGISFRPEWCITVGLDYPKGAQNVAHLLGSLPSEIRPDALLILNDNIVEYACAGLVAAQIQVPRDMAVVVHCCLPWPVPSVLPLMRIGFDAREALKQTVQMINASRQGEAVRDAVMPAKFYNDLPNSMGFSS